MKSTQQNFGLLESKAALSEFRALKKRASLVESTTKVLLQKETKGRPDLEAFEAALREARESPKPKHEAKDWAAQFNS